MKVKIRFNKSRGQPGRGTEDHVWRVFAGGREYLVKHVEIQVPCKGEKECCSQDWNIVCEGNLHIDRETSTVIVAPLL